MNSEQPNPPINPEKERAKEDSYLHDTVDPQDLAYTNRTVSDPDELLNNPAVTPQMLNEPADIREGFKFDRGKD